MLRIANPRHSQLAEKSHRQWTSTGPQELLREPNRGKVRTRRLRAREPVSRLAVRRREQHVSYKVGATTPRKER